MMVYHDIMMIILMMVMMVITMKALNRALTVDLPRGLLRLTTWVINHLAIRIIIHLRI